MNASRKVFLFAIFFSFISTVCCISCYQCFYDNNFPDLPKTSLDCARNPFDESKVKIQAGFKQCYKAIVYEDDEIVSAHRGGGSANIFEIAEKISRDQDSISVQYCYEELCNSAPPSFVTSLGFITSSVVLLRSLYY